MKLHSKILMAVAGCALAGGIGTALSVTSISDALPAKADGPAEGYVRIWLNKGSIGSSLTWWITDETYFYYESDSGEHNITTGVTKVNDTNFYYDMSTAEWSSASFQFYVYDLSKIQNKTEWVAASTLTNDYGYASYLVINSANGNAAQTYNTYFCHEDCGYRYLDSLPSTSDTRRIWVAKGGVDSWFFDSNVGIRVYYSSTDIRIYKMIATNGYYYADIPLDAPNFNAFRYSTTVNGGWNFSQGMQGVSDAKFVYINEADADGNQGVSYGYPNVVSGALFAKIVEGYTTCLSNNVNGYGAYSNLNTGYYASMTEDAKSTFAATDISDYNYTEYYNQSKSYSSLSKGVTVKAGAKWEKMGAMSAAPQASGANVVNQAEATNNMGVVAGVSVIGSIAAAGGLIFLRKRRIF